MAGVLPPKDFASAKLQIHTVSAGHRFGRIFLERYPNALGFGKTPSRFSDPRKRITAHRFGVLYLGQTIRVCFLEAVLRDIPEGDNVGVVATWTPPRPLDDVMPANFEAGAKDQMRRAISIVRPSQDCLRRTWVRRTPSGWVVIQANCGPKL